MSLWDPKTEWRRLQLQTDALAIYEGLLAGTLNESSKILVERKCETYGDLKAIIGVIKHAKDLKDIEAKGGKAAEAVQTIVGLLPGADAFFNWAQVPGKVFNQGKDFYTAVVKGMDALEGVDDDSGVLKKAGGTLDAFKIDDGYQEITDEKLEQKFFDDFGRHLDTKDPTKELPDKDINEFFEDWLSKNIGTDVQTVKGAAEDTKFTDIPAIEEPSKLKKSVDRIGGALKGALGKFIGFK
ncbi:MAG: hypothetical protein CBD74_02295 [Saprospirales bacterium TMED214]|nr:MAG: hypothetical protein CBD74_02295 [Saprospirales bacterium TMED214]